MLRKRQKWGRTLRPNETGTENGSTTTSVSAKYHETTQGTHPFRRLGQILTSPKPDSALGLTTWRSKYSCTRCMHMKSVIISEEQTLMWKNWQFKLFFKVITVATFTFSPSLWLFVDVVLKVVSVLSLNQSCTDFSGFQKRRGVATRLRAPSMQVCGNQLGPGVVSKLHDQLVPNHKIQPIRDCLWCASALSSRKFRFCCLC